MRTEKAAAFFKKNAEFILHTIISLFVFILFLTGILQKLDMRLYDWSLGKSADVAENEDILIVDIDDESLNKIGMWPWTRDILADALIRMKELGAGTAVFDIEYLSPSSKTADKNILEITQNAVTDTKDALSEGLTEFGNEIKEGKISSFNAEKKTDDFINEKINPELEKLYFNLSDKLEFDNDDYFARAIQFFGNSSMTVNTRNIGVKEDEKNSDYTYKRFLFDNVSDPEGLINRGNDWTAREAGNERAFVPAISDIMSHAWEAGFTNVVIDSDGTRRRVELLNFYNGKYTGQLGFAPLCKIMDVQSFERKRNCLILKGALFPGKNERKDIKIPLDSHGRMNINWLKKNYEESFRHVPIYLLNDIDSDEENLVKTLALIYENRFSAKDSDEADFIAYSKDILAEYADCISMKKKMLEKCQGYDLEGNAIGGGLDEKDYESYFQARKVFFEDVKNFSSSLVFINKDNELYQKLNFLSEKYDSEFKILYEVFSNSFCLLGNSATSSTDLGVTPFERRYANIGTHANVINTIIQQDFIREINGGWGILFAFLLIFVILFMTKKINPGKRNVSAIIYLVLIPLFVFSMMILFRIHIPSSGPVIIAFASFVSEMIVNFMNAEDEKKYIKNQFGSYVSPDYVDILVKDRSRAKVGGESACLTALFSDVKTFSGFTETVNKEELAKARRNNEALPLELRKSEEEVESLGAASGAQRLVSYLNDYLGDLSNVILENHGTLDKFVGDEIVSFFGAPVHNDNNAFDACTAAIRMRQAEEKYNREHENQLPLDENGKPFFLHSRIGLNTGDMVVGNMGTELKLNYTVMGNNVNLASRLEGTNKVYGSWIMCSESTWKAANRGENEGKIVARKLDMVRVINVKQPVQLYSILGFYDEMSEKQLEAASVFNEGIEFYLKGSEDPFSPKKREELDEARKLFIKSQNIYPEDESSRVFAERCTLFLENGIPSPWDGVYTMKSK